MLKYFYLLIIIIVYTGTAVAQQTKPQAQIKVQGIVIDYLTSQPVKGALINVKNSLKSINTGNDGKFVVDVPSQYSVVVVSFPGYQQTEFALHGKDQVTIVLTPEGINNGESTVRLPYYTANSKNLNGAYTVIQNTDDRYRDVYQMLQGTVPGLETNSYSGVPGEGMKLNMRGVRSLYTTNDPLIVLDGVPIVNLISTNSLTRGNVFNYLSTINVKDIETITVLRDVSAAGIYGSRAANGAIVITTKGGTNGKTFLDVSAQTSYSPRFKELPVMNSTQYKAYLANKINAFGLNQQTINTTFPFFNMNPASAAYLPYSNNTDWQKVVSRNAVSTDFYLNLRGGDATSKYAFNVGYNDAGGNIRGTSIGNLTARFNLDFKILKDFYAGAKISYINTNKTLMDQGYEERLNPLYLGLTKPPIFSPYVQSSPGVNSPFYTQPSYDNLSNPTAVVTNVDNEVKNYWILASVYGQFNFTNHLNTKLTVTLDRRGLQEDRFTPSLAIVPQYNDIRYDRTSEEQMQNRQALTIEHTLTYEKDVSSSSHILVFGGYNFELGKYTSGYGIARHSTDDQFQGLGDGTRVTSDGVRENYNNVSVFVNGEYNFREKLFLKAGARLDGSSKFGKDADGLRIGSIPFAFLPYTGLTWRVKSEPWMHDFNLLDAFNIRGSWGITANQDIPVNAQYSLYGSSFNGPYPGLVPISIGNSSLKWETTNSWNLGADLAIHNTPLTIQVDYFNSRTKDLLVPEPISGQNGQSFYWANGGTINNRGLEVGITARGHAGNFIWNAGVNIARYQTKILSLTGTDSYIDGANGYSSIAGIGNPTGLIYGNKYLGVFSTSTEASAAGLTTELGTPYKAGDIHYADVNGDKIINNKDMQVIGNSNPKFFGGLNGSVSYKGFDLQATFSYVYGNDVLNVLRSKLEDGVGYENQAVQTLTAWTREGDVTNIPQTLQGDPARNRRPSSQFIEDGSYLKMRSLTIGYTFKQNKIYFMRSAQVYLTGYNLFTATKYSGYDPEVAVNTNSFTRGYDFGNVPLTRTVMLGLKIGL